jgi:hypothetical protein
MFTTECSAFGIIITANLIRDIRFSDHLRSLGQAQVFKQF